MKTVLLVFSFLFASTLSGLPPSRTKLYRSDYVYNEQTDAFYKLHIESRPIYGAKIVCESEGASLLLPATHGDIIQAHVLFKLYPDLGNVMWITSDEKQYEFFEKPLIDLNTDVIHYGGGCEVLTREGKAQYDDCYNNLPFICKVEAKDVPYDSLCDVLANDYNYIESVGSCYKIPRRVATWNEAYAECRRENAHLVILNSEAEKTVVQALMQNTPPVAGAQASEYFYAGYKAENPVANEPIVYKTIFNETLPEAGFAVWSPGEPNNLFSKEYCGTLYKDDGLLNDIFCDFKYAFICEKEVNKSP